MEEKKIHLVNSKTLVPMISSLKTQDKALVTKIKQKIKQRSMQTVTEPLIIKDTIFGASQTKPRRAKISLLSSGKSKSQEIIKKLGLPIFIYNNSQKQKIIQASIVKAPTNLLVIRRANIFQKQLNQSINSSTSRRSTIKILNGTQLSASVELKSSLQKRMSKFSGFYLNYNQQSQKDAQKNRFARNSKENMRGSNLISKSQLNFFQLLCRYLQMIKNTCEETLLLYLDVEKYSEKTRPVFKLENCNSNIVESVLKKRWWWKDSILSNDKRPTLLWTQLKNDIFFAPNQKDINPDSQKIDSFELFKGQSSIQLHNHIKNSRYISNKIALFQISQKTNYKDIKIPKKYYIPHKQSKYWTKFQSQNYQQCKKKGKNIYLGYLQQNNKIWIMKNAQNHDKDHFLKISNNFEDIDCFLNEHLSIQQTFIIEEYIRNPFLYKSRKFNVKCFALLTKIQNSVKFYWYDEGIIEISCEDYDKDKQNPYIHFASEAIQINHPRFGENQLQNKINFQQFQDFLNKIDYNCRDFKRNAVPIMKNTAKSVIEAAYYKIIQQNESSFQLLQYNYIIDSDFVPWLISSHTNPSLQATCPLLQKLFPRLIDDMFKLSIDLYYPPPKTWPKNKYYLLSKNICQNGFQEVHLEPNCTSSIETFEFENKIEDEKRCYENNIEQQDMTLMHFFPEKMNSQSVNSITFSK